VTADENQSEEAKSETAAGALSEIEQAEAREYGRISLSLTLADMALDFVYLAIMAFVFARPLDAWLAGFDWLAGDKSILRLLALLGVVTGIHILVSLPLSFYAGYVVEHRFKLSNQSLRRWVWTWFKRNAFGLVLTALIFAGLYWMIWHTGSYWWLIAAGVFFLFSVILGQLAPVVFLPLFYSTRSRSSTIPRSPSGWTSWRRGPDSRSKASTGWACRPTP
jgi:STE24 endopeptidase